MLFKRSFAVLGSLFILLNFNTANAQCSVVSTNGWVATFSITPTAVVPEFTSCPNYYHYEIRYNYSVTFTGSTSGRSVSANIYFTCSGGTGGLIYQSLGTFTATTSGTFTTANNARQYTAVSTNNYGSNPSCNTVTLADVNCTSVRIDYYGNGITNGSINCALSASPLPIELLDFQANANKDKVDLKWATASETNNDFFTIEKSADGINFVEQQKVKGSGNTSNTTEYATTDENPFTGTSYYRLKQMDFNGNTSYSGVVSVQINNSSPAITNVYPNPANNGTTNIYVSSTSAAPVDAYIYNPLGQMVAHMVLKPNDKGLLDQPVDLPLNGNLFFITLSQNNKIIGHHKLCVTNN